MEKAPISYVRFLRSDSSVAAALKDLKRKQMGPRVDSNDNSYVIDRNGEEYEEWLPDFAGISFGEHLAQRVATGEDVSVLDLGCGEGKFLHELHEAYPEISVSGLSRTDLRPTTDDTAGIDYRVGDMHRLEKIFEGTRFDFVVSVWSLFHSADPLSIVKQTYQVLKPGGIAFLQSPELRMTPRQRDMLVKYWVEQGIRVEMPGGLDHMIAADQNGTLHTIDDLYDMSFQRSSTPKMHMPFSYIHPDQIAVTQSNYELSIPQSPFSKELTSTPKGL